MPEASGRNLAPQRREGPDVAVEALFVVRPADPRQAIRSTPHLIHQDRTPFGPDNPTGEFRLTSITPPTDRPVLFEWLHLLAIAQGRGSMPAKRAAVATLIALDSHGTTGEDARVDDEQIALELGVHRATVWRHVAALSDAGWMERVSAAIGAAKGKPGRRAVYRLTVPILDLLGKGLPTDVENVESCRTITPDDATRPVDNDPDLVSHPAEGDATRVPVDNQPRVAKRHTSCRTITPDDATLPPSTDLRLSTPLLETCTNDGRDPVDKTSRSELVAEARAAIRRSA